MEEKTELKFKKICAISFTVLILAFLALGFLFNKKIIKAPLEEMQNGDIKFGQFIEKVGGAYQDDVAFKNSFININGLFARATGRNHYNNVTRLKNGMLTSETIYEINVKPSADGITDFSSYLKSIGIDYMLVMAPSKLDLDDSLLPTGTVNFGNINVNRFLNALQNKVDFIDLRQYLSANVELVEKYFYNTDHHWNTDGAFEAFKIILNQLNEKYPDANIDMSLADIDNWDVTIYKNCFLGSLGKRVGIFYGGLDDFSLYTPKFDTDMSMYIPKYRAYYSGTFEDSVVVGKKYLTNKDFFNENPYCAYIGGDYPIVHHRNSSAPSDLKVLIIKDSFVLPVQSFMSTVFKEVDVIDPRHFTECTLAEYVEISQPDIVITLITQSSVGQSVYYNTGISKAEYHHNQTSESVVAQREKLELTANSDSMYVYNVLMNKVPFNTKFTLSFDDVEFLQGDAECITVALYNSTTQQFVCNYALDIDYCRANGGFEWTFLSPETGSDNLQILIYAGRHSQTGGNSVRFTNVIIKQYS